MLLKMLGVTILKRVWVHTCTLDHPNALRNYIARGMNIFKKENIKSSLIIIWNIESLVNY